MYSRDFQSLGLIPRQLVFTGKNGKDSLKNLQIVTLKGVQGYTIIYTAKIDDDDKFVQTAERIIKSSEINIYTVF